MIVDLNELKRVRDYINKINEVPLEDIQWIQDGVDVGKVENCFEVKQASTELLSNCALAELFLLD